MGMFLGLHCIASSGEHYQRPFTVSGIPNRVLLTNIGVYGHLFTPCYRKQSGAISRVNRWQTPKHYTACYDRIALSPWINDDIDDTTLARNKRALQKTATYQFVNLMTTIQLTIGILRCYVLWAVRHPLGRQTLLFRMQNKQVRY